MLHFCSFSIFFIDFLSVVTVFTVKFDRTVGAALTRAAGGPCGKGSIPRAKDPFSLQGKELMLAVRGSTEVAPWLARLDTERVVRFPSDTAGPRDAAVYEAVRRRGSKICSIIMAARFKERERGKENKTNR